MNESEKQFSFTRAASITSGRAKNQIPIGWTESFGSIPQSGCRLQTKLTCKEDALHAIINLCAMKKGQAGHSFTDHSFN